MRNVYIYGDSLLKATVPDEELKYHFHLPEIMARYPSDRVQVTNRAMLSRAQAGIRKGTLILNLPGSPKAAQENLEAVLPAISHGLEMLSGRPADCAKLTD